MNQKDGTSPDHNKYGSLIRFLLALAYILLVILLALMAIYFWQTGIHHPSDFKPKPTSAQLDFSSSKANGGKVADLSPIRSMAEKAAERILPDPSVDFANSNLRQIEISVAQDAQEATRQCVLKILARNHCPFLDSGSGKGTRLIVTLRGDQWDTLVSALEEQFTDIAGRNGSKNGGKRSDGEAEVVGEIDIHSSQILPNDAMLSIWSSGGTTVLKTPVR